MTVAMVSPFFILKFLSCLGLYLFLRKFFPGIAKIFRSHNFRNGITRIAGDRLWPQNNDAAPPRRLSGDGARRSWVSVEGSLNPDYS